VKRFAVAFLTISLQSISLPAIAATYTTNFPVAEDPISENGRWIGGKTAGLAWADFQSMPSFFPLMGSSPPLAQVKLVNP